MTKWIETTGKNEEAAIASALEQLGLDRDEVSVEVLERAKSGFLGLGSTPAKVRVRYEGEEDAAPFVAAPAAGSPAAEQSAAAPAAHGQAAVSDGGSQEEREGDPEAAITEFLTGLLAQMRVSATPKLSPRTGGGYLVSLEGERLGAIIGHRGETLDAIQQLCNYSVNRGRQKRVRIHIDAENYRAKREESLQRLAQKVAAKVIKYRRNITLEPMNAYERHVIHEALQDYGDVVTYSTGTEPNRRTVVAFTKGKHNY